MSAHEVRCWRFECDGCGDMATALATHRSEPSPPKGWKLREREAHDCGLTGYCTSIRQHFCPACAINRPTTEPVEEA